MVKKVETRIPKIIHYVWVGEKPKYELVKKCIDSWKKNCKDYKIIEWNEKNYDLSRLPKVIKQAYKDRKWAFVADYIRLDILYNFGGVYLDTDMLLIKSIDELLKYDFFIAKEKEDRLNAAVVGSIKKHFFLRKVLDEYKSLDELDTIPRIITRIYKSLNDKIRKKKIKVLSIESFYPLPFEKRKDNYMKYITEKTYGVHLWDYSWQHPLHKFLERIHLWKPIISLLEITKIKKPLKKILKIKF